MTFVPGGESSPPGPGKNSAGLALFRYQSKCGTVYGHTGNFPGYTTFIAATADGRRSAVVQSARSCRRRCRPRRAPHTARCGAPGGSRCARRWPSRHAARHPGVPRLPRGGGGARERPAGAAPRLPSSIAKLERSLAAGRTTCQAVTRTALGRIRAVNPTTHAVIEVNPDAPAIARRLDARRRAGRRPRPLECLPLLLKANYGTGDRLQTTAGSVVMAGFRTAQDSFAARRLRGAGAVILGKTNMDEWAHGVAGYSSLGGQTANGRRATRGPSGSSGGSASAVAGGMALVAMGSDTGGSIQGPAAWNGVVGLRPTVGLVSRDGVIPFASFTDVLGPLTRSVADLARVMGATGVDPADPATHGSRFRRDYTSYLDRDGLRGARIGVLDSIAGIELTADSDQVEAAFGRAVTRMRRSGATIVGGLAFDVPGFTLDGIGLITASQFHAELDAWLRGPGRGAPSGTSPRWWSAALSRASATASSSCPASSRR